MGCVGHIWSLLHILLCFPLQLFNYIRIILSLQPHKSRLWADTCTGAALSSMEVIIQHIWKTGIIVGKYTGHHGLKNMIWILWNSLNLALWSNTLSMIQFLHKVIKLKGKSRRRRRRPILGQGMHRIKGVIFVHPWKIKAPYFALRGMRRHCIDFDVFKSLVWIKPQLWVLTLTGLNNIYWVITKCQPLFWFIFID